MSTSIKKNLENIEKTLHKSIDDEVSLEKEINEVARFTATSLMKVPITTMTIQNRDFIIVKKDYKNDMDKKCVQIAAREKTKIDISAPKVIKADLQIDNDYSMEENLTVILKGLLGHITGIIKPEKVD